MGKPAPTYISKHPLGPHVVFPLNSASPCLLTLKCAPPEMSFKTGSPEMNLNTSTVRTYGVPDKDVYEVGNILHATSRSFCMEWNLE